MISRLLMAVALMTFHLVAAENRVVLNLEPTRENPRNSEGSFVTLKSGKVLFVYTQFYGGAADESPAHLAVVESEDAGRTWSAPRVLVENHAGNNVMSASLLRLKSGRVAMLYLVKNSWLDCRPYLQISEDDGKTWSEARLICQAPGYFVVNNDRLIQLASGRLVLPMGFHRSRGTDPKSSRTFDSRATAHFLLSDDEGKTWREADQWLALPMPATRTGLQEPGVVELTDGCLLGYARTDQGKQFEFRSLDAGRTWTLPAAGNLSSPASPASLKRLPGSSELLALWNDHSGRYPFAKGKRTPLIAGISSDGGKTWPRQVTIENDPDGWYCYTAIHFTDDAILLGYCAGDNKVGGLNRLRIRRLSLDWLRDNAK